MTRRTAALPMIAAAIAAALLAVPRPATARDHLETGEVAVIGGASAALLVLGRHLQDVGARHDPRWTEPPAFDRWVTEHLAPPPTHERRNFMQSDRAGMVNVAVGSLLVGTVDGGWPGGERTGDMLEGQFLYWSGLAALSGVQAAFKGTVARQRPLARLAPDAAARRTDVEAAHHQRSFWSGHASSAFFASTFLNLRVRDAMRRELTAERWDAWSWTSPTVLFSWAGWVAWSRVHAYEHWLSDVVVGAAAGWACAELFSSFAPGHGGGATAVKRATPLLSFTIGF